MRRSTRISERAEALKLVAANDSNVKPLKDLDTKKTKASNNKITKKANEKVTPKTKTTSKSVKPSKGKVTKKSKTNKGNKTVTKTNRGRSNKKNEVIVLDDPKEEKETDDDIEDLDEEDKELEEGDSLPEDLKVELQDSKEINLLDYAKKAHILIIFAYPRASTPGCTRQAQGFRDEYKELNGDLKASVLGLSADTITAQTKFKDKQNLPYNLISDTKKELIKLLGCKKYPSGIIRSHFIFVDGVLKFKKLKISPEVSYKSALEQVKELSE